LETLTKISSEKFQLVYQCASVRRVTGWHQLWSTPKTNEYAMETGSVFLFAYLDSLDNALSEALFDLEEQGVGRRRAEGFGRVCVSDPFHLEVKLR
jgi:CRISPR-associated protein Csx10